jgi:lipopolysaccharide transport system permease protein
MKETALTIQSDLPRTRREPSKKWAWPKLRELWEYRELLFFFAWRDIKVRYRQTVMGVLWAIIQPFLTMVIFSLFLAGWPTSRPMDCPILSLVMLH